MIGLRPRADAGDGSVAEAPPPIEEIEDRLEDLTEALREAGDDDTADRLDQHADGFSDVNSVRREVSAVQQQLVPGLLLQHQVEAFQAYQLYALLQTVWSHSAILGTHSNPCS